VESPSKPFQKRIPVEFPEIPLGLITGAIEGRVPVWFITEGASAKGTIVSPEGTSLIPSKV
jgi:hypothetical protein